LDGSPSPPADAAGPADAASTDAAEDADDVCTTVHLPRVRCCPSALLPVRELLTGIPSKPRRAGPQLVGPLGVRESSQVDDGNGTVLPLNVSERRNYPSDWLAMTTSSWSTSSFRKVFSSRSMCSRIESITARMGLTESSTGVYGTSRSASHNWACS